MTMCRNGIRGSTGRSHERRYDPHDTTRLDGSDEHNSPLLYVEEEVMRIPIKRPDGTHWEEVMSDEPSKEVSTWVDPAMYTAEPTEGVLPKVTLLSATPDPLGALGAMCAMYEGRVIRDLD